MSSFTSCQEETEKDIVYKIYNNFIEEDSLIEVIFSGKYGFICNDQRGHPNSNFEFPCYIENINESGKIKKNRFCVLVMRRLTFFKMFTYIEKIEEHKNYILKFKIKDKKYYELIYIDELEAPRDIKRLEKINEIPKQFNNYIKQMEKNK